MECAMLVQLQLAGTHEETSRQLSQLANAMATLLHQHNIRGTVQTVVLNHEKEAQP